MLLFFYTFFFFFYLFTFYVSIVLYLLMLFSIKKITIHEENAAKEQRKCSIEEKLLSGKVRYIFFFFYFLFELCILFKINVFFLNWCMQLHAVVEYNTVEAAENAVSLKLSSFLISTPFMIFIYMVYIFICYLYL